MLLYWNYRWLRIYVLYIWMLRCIYMRWLSVECCVSICIEYIYFYMRCVLKRPVLELRWRVAWSIAVVIAADWRLDWRLSLSLACEDQALAALLENQALEAYDYLRSWKIATVQSLCWPLHNIQDFHVYELRIIRLYYPFLYEHSCCVCS